MPHPTLRAIGATAALAFAVGATTACSQDKASRAEQDLTEQLKKYGLTSEEERWLRKTLGPADALKKPPPYSENLVPAKLGPNTFNFPMNLYDNQTGPDFQGSVGLMLQWPTLEAFPPGAVGDPAYRRAYINQTVDVSLMYIDKVPIDTLMEARIAPRPGVSPDDPARHIEHRIHGASVYGLTPFYIDRERMRAYLKKEGAPTDEGHVSMQGDDWYIDYSASGKPQTFITCSPRELPGAKLIDGQLEDTPVGVGRGDCTHTFVITDLKLSLRVTYLRAYLRDWKQIEDALRAKVNDAFLDGRKVPQ